MSGNNFSGFDMSSFGTMQPNSKVDIQVDFFSKPAPPNPKPAQPSGDLIWFT